MRRDAIPRLSPQEIGAHLDALSRQPFSNLLKRLLDAEPDAAAVKRFAERQPEGWGQLVSMTARLAGFTDRHAVEHTHAVVVSQVSDSELNRRLAEALERFDLDPEQGLLPDLSYGGDPAQGNGSGGE